MALRPITRVALVAACALAALTVIGLRFGLSRIVSVVPGAPEMSPLTAVCILLTGASLWLRTRATQRSLDVRIGVALAACVIALSLVRLWPLRSVDPSGLGLALFLDTVLIGVRGSRMQMSTAAALLCMAAALVALDAGGRIRRWLVAALPLVALGLASVALIGYAYGAPPMRAFMAVNTALAIALLAFALLMARPERGLCGLLCSHSPGGTAARKVIPAAVLVPFCLGWLGLKGQEAGLYDTEMGTGITMLLLSSFMIALTWRTGRALDAAERSRQDVVEALRRSVDRYTRLVDANPIGVLTATDNGMVRDANPAFLTLLGYGREELPISGVAMNAPEWQAANEGAWEELAEGGAMTPLEKEYLRKDGSRVHVLVGAVKIPDSDGETMAFVVDLTAQREAETRLEQMRGFLETIIQHLPSMVFVKDAKDLKMLQLNRAGEVFLGVTREQVIGKHVHEFFPAAEAAYFIAKDREVLDSGVLLDLPEDHVCNHAGEIRILHTKKVPILDQHGEPLYLLGISEDITDSKHAEARLVALHAGLQRRTAELEVANKELEAFSYSVSHDLRAPLRHINGFADLLMRREGSGLDEKGQRHLKAISESARDMGELIDDLLAFSRMNRTEMQETRVDLAALVQRVWAELADQRGAAELRMGALPIVTGDAAMLRLVFTNLIANALKYSSRRAAPVIEVDTQPAEDEAIVFVRDNGVGFDMRFEHKLFGVFQRLHSDEDFPGTGIGLANVQRVVARHQGRVWAKGVVDIGATFYVALPHRAAAELQKEAA